MEKQDVFDQLKKIADKFGVETENISEKSSLESDLNLDSLDSADFLMECEQHFGISLPLNVIAHISSVGDLVEAVYHKLEQSN